MIHDLQKTITRNLLNFEIDAFLFSWLVMFSCIWGTLHSWGSFQDFRCSWLVNVLLLPHSQEEGKWSDINYCCTHFQPASATNFNMDVYITITYTCITYVPPTDLCSFLLLFHSFLCGHISHDPLQHNLHTWKKVTAYWMGSHTIHVQLTALLHWCGHS